MSRIEIDDLKDFLPQGIELTDTQYEMAILSASSLIAKGEEACLMGMSDDLLKSIELYLAAHYVVPFDQSLSLSSSKDPCCDTQESFSGSFGTGFDSTTYGQRANELSCGCLEDMSKAPVNLYSLGSLGSCL